MISKVSAVLSLAVLSVCLLGASANLQEIIDAWDPNGVIEALWILDEDTGDIYQRQVFLPGDLFKLIKKVDPAARRLDVNDIAEHRHLATGTTISSLEPAMGAEIDGTATATTTFSASIGQDLSTTDLEFVFVDPAGVETIIPVIAETEVVGAPPVATELVGGFATGSWQWYVKGKDATTGTGVTSERWDFTVVGTIVQISGTPAQRNLASNIITGTVTQDAWEAGGGQISKVVGRLYYRQGNQRKVCSGTAVKDYESGRSLILTAGHCK